jgi:hypothetical protein
LGSAGEWGLTMTHPTLTSHPKLTAWLYACSMLVLAACDVASLDADAEFRAAELELPKPGQCLPLDDELTSVTTEAWSLPLGLPEGIIIDDHLLLTSIFEDNVMLRISGPAGTEGDVLIAATATAFLDDPELENDCGFCDGLCVDGKCIMDLPPYAISRDGICHE